MNLSFINMTILQTQQSSPLVKMAHCD